MSDPDSFALAVLLIGVAGLVTVGLNRIASRLPVPAPAVVLVAAAIAVNAIPDLHAPSHRAVEDVVSVALVLILFDGGRGIGWRRLRPVVGPVVALGVLGTFLTVGGLAAFLYYVIGLSWYAAALVATAIAPTDPAMVFSVFGQRDIPGHGATILEGESGANDPVGIALMAGLISAGGLSGGAIGEVAAEFGRQMSIGLAIGLAAGFALRWLLHRVVIPNVGLYPLGTLAFALAAFGVTTLAHGSGFLAVFVAGIVVGDTRGPSHREVDEFHSVAAGLGEVVAFVVLGLTVNLSDLGRADAWVPGVITAVLLIVVVRPALVAPCLIGARLRFGEGLFVLFAGLKGAVPILLGTLVLTAPVADGRRLYAIVVVVVVFSAVIQASLVPSVADRLLPRSE